MIRADDETEPLREYFAVVESLLERARHVGTDVLVVSVACADVVRIWVQPVSPRGGATALGLLATLPLLARRRLPLAAPLVAFAGYLGLALLVRGSVAEQLQFFLGALLCFWITGSENPRLRALVGLAAGLAVTAVAVATDPSHHGVGDFIFGFVITVAAWGAGAVLGTRARAAKAAERRAERLELEQELRAREAVSHERARIARELHDVIAHTVSVMVVQAGAAEQVLDGENAAAREALAAIRESGKGALLELRRLLGLLREEKPGELAPQPTLRDLDQLIAHVEAAGLPVTLEQRGEARPLSPGLAQAAYRIVQEALTNTIKHADAHRVDVTVEWQPDAVHFLIVDDGRGANAPRTNGGHGLIGMRERAQLYGGHLEAGPRTDSRGYAVSATLPL
jgi:signal transduction histidine kinase